MVPLASILDSNSRLSTLPTGLVAIFIGATAGIGEITLKKFVQYARQPRAYLVGRSQSAADRIIASCKELNHEGEYIFIKADVSLIRNVDEVCAVIKAREKTINILFLSAALPVLDHSETPEGLPTIAALNFYSRHRFITALLPLLRQATSLRRIITIAVGSFEGPLNPNDFPGRHTSLLTLRGHFGTLITLSLEAAAERAPEVSFVHEHPGTVNTSFMQRVQGPLGILLRSMVWLGGRWLCIPVEESGERHLFLACSGRFPARVGDEGSGVEWKGEVARGTTGVSGGGVYSVGWSGESAGLEVERLLEGYREKGMVEDIWRHAESEFRRITGEDAAL